jgi:hypothetical protein
MRSGLGHRVVWYMVLNVLRSIPGLSSQAVRRSRQYVCTGRNHGHQQSDYTVPYPGRL